MALVAMRSHVRQACRAGCAVATLILNNLRRSMLTLNGLVSRLKPVRPSKTGWPHGEPRRFREMARHLLAPTGRHFSNSDEGVAPTLRATRRYPIGIGSTERIAPPI